MNFELKSVCRDFAGRDGITVALEKFDLSIPAGEFLCIVGPSGCGKSTLLNLLAGLDRPTAGEVRAGGERVTGPDPSRVMIFQEAALFPWLDVQANVEFGLRMRGVPAAVRRETALRLLGLVHLEQSAHAWVHELSGGMKQRVALARALAPDPAILLMDEPFGALDAITRTLLHTQLQEIWAQTHKTVVFVTHNVREAAVLGDRVLVLSARPGRVTAEHRVDLPRPRHIDDLAIAEWARRISADLKIREMTDAAAL